MAKVRHWQCCKCKPVARSLSTFAWLLTVHDELKWTHAHCFTSSIILFRFHRAIQHVCNVYLSRADPIRSGFK